MLCRWPALIGPGSFAVGAVHYEDRYPGHAEHARIVVEVSLAGRLNTQAVVDTGSPWCIIDPEMAGALGGVIEDTGHEERLTIRGDAWPGRLGRLQIGLRAEYGDDLWVDATVFTPSDGALERWPYPNFIGLAGFLERVRFAVDPYENLFYFGADV